MTSGLVVILPSFLGPFGFLVGTLLVLVLVLVALRVVFSLAWELIVVGVVVLGVLWLLRAVSAGPPGLG